MRDRLAKHKKALNALVESGVAAVTKEIGTAMLKVPEKALQAEHRARRMSKWKKDNKTGIDAWNRLVEEDGLWAEKYQDE